MEDRNLEEYSKRKKEAKQRFMAQQISMFDYMEGKR